MSNFTSMKSLLKGILTNIYTKLHQFLISSFSVFAALILIRRRYINHVLT